MASFVTMLVISVLVFIASIILGVKNYKWKKEKKITSIDYKRKNENRSLLISVLGSIFSAIVMIYTLLNSVPVPTIYPLDNEAKVYNETVKISISSNPLLKTYYSLDGSDPKDGYIYEDDFIITEITTISVKNKFCFFLE